MRLTPEQHRDVFLAAKRDGTSVSKWVRRTLTAAATEPGQAVSADADESPRARPRAPE